MEYDRDDRTKIYSIKRKQESSMKAIPCDDNIKFFLLYHEINERPVKAMRKKLINKKIIFENIDDTDLAYDDNIDVINNYDYLVVIVSEQLLEDFDLMSVLLTNYYAGENNKKIIPVIIWKDIYIPETKAELIKYWQKRIEEYKETCFDGDFNGYVAADLSKMQQILEMLKSFLQFATNRDKKKSLSIAEKLLKYIKYDRGIELQYEGGERDHKTFNLNAKQINIAYDSSTINASQANDS